jgi:Flp pilus assembly protein TadD
MRIHKQITAALLLAGLVAAGCSNSDKASATSSPEAQPAARVAPVSLTTTDSPAPNPTPNVAGPVTFVDGEAAYRAGNYGEATRVFEKYTKQQPDNPWGQFMYGLSAWKSGDLAKAEMALEEALRIDPEHFKSLVNLSRILLDQRRYDDALERLTVAGELDPNSVDVHRLLGRTYNGQGKFDEAVEAYRRAIELDDKDAWSMNNLGHLFLVQGRPQDALPLLARAVLLKKDVAVFHNNLGMALEHTGRFTAAATAYNSAVTLDPNFTKAQKNLARVAAVKVSPEEPFDLEAIAGQVEQTEKPVDETTTNH